MCLLPTFLGAYSDRFYVVGKSELTIMPISCMIDILVIALVLL